MDVFKQIKFALRHFYNKKRNFDITNKLHVDALDELLLQIDGILALLYTYRILFNANRKERNMIKYFEKMLDNARR